MVFRDRKGFWRDAFAWRGSITPLVMPYVLAFGLFAAMACFAAGHVERRYGVQIGLEVAPFEYAGAALSLLLILRTNAGHDRWWEARKLWGGIVNQSRNIVISALSYGPADAAWKARFVRWASVFPHVTRCSLRGERPSSEIAALVGEEHSRQIAAADHMPSFVVLKLAELLQEACVQFDMDRFAFLQVDRERAALIDHIGACERILKSPLPLVYAIKIRRCIALLLLTLPFALLPRVHAAWLAPLITMMVAYPLLSLDQIGIEIQNPFSKANVGHLPIGDLTDMIERNLLALLHQQQPLEGKTSS